MMAWVGNMMGPKMPINSNILAKITSTLTFDDSLAREKFGWSPKRVLEKFQI
jgi:hypothetical protein